MGKGRNVSQCLGLRRQVSREPQHEPLEALEEQNPCIFRVVAMDLRMEAIGVAAVLRGSVVQAISRLSVVAMNPCIFTVVAMDLRMEALGVAAFLRASVIQAISRL